MRFVFRGYSFSYLDFVVFFCGLSVMVIEILGARMLSPFFGNTFYVWTSIIGVIMISLARGYW
ncbi:MAG: hypothetical protein KKD39_08520, partial [Candidatus Altiarchaeota archaeon]|nr:hypothetical protein [Candidatus Altiarchaeota archaeon]